MVRWIRGQAYGEVRTLGKRHQALHELGAPTVALRTVVQIDEQGRDVGKALFDALPPVDQPIHQAVTGDFGNDPKEKEFIGGGQENAHRCHGRHGLKIVVGGLSGHATLASPCKGTHPDGGFGIDREP